MTDDKGFTMPSPIIDTMKDGLTVADLNNRWEKALCETKSAVSKRPGVYRKLKTLAGDIVGNPLDIKDYLPSARKLVVLLNQLDPAGRGSIFHLFNDRLAPSDVRYVPWLRMECTDLLAHLKAFEKWRLQTSGLKVIK